MALEGTIALACVKPFRGTWQTEEAAAAFFDLLSATKRKTMVSARIRL